uniref:Uncharacterized protein n=1 Tax=Mustela putorius furo TaxID=9669 RepID=M3YFH5_MUSPF
IYGFHEEDRAFVSLALIHPFPCFCLWRPCCPGFLGKVEEEGMHEAHNKYLFNIYLTSYIFSLNMFLI